jgi:hypothetical protein
MRSWQGIEFISAGSDFLVLNSVHLTQVTPLARERERITRILLSSRKRIQGQVSQGGSSSTREND